MDKIVKEERTYLLNMVKKIKKAKCNVLLIQKSILRDAVNDLSVPYHLLTREFDDAVRRLLAPDGVYMVSVIDRYHDGRLLPAVLRTIGAAFPTVQLLSPSPRWSTACDAGWFAPVTTRRRLVSGPGPPARAAGGEDPNQSSLYASSEASSTSW